MKPQERAIARKNIDKKLILLKNSGVLTRPQRGWVKAIRDALGMTTAQFGRRMGVSQPRASNVEKAEASGKITLESLERAAAALDCRLFYALVPHESLDAQVKARARELAEKHLASVSHSMALEDQKVLDEDTQAQLERLIEQLLKAPGSKLWDKP
jgi:predicted DNA-binding mobile mystery protein A